jgi:ubiquinone/menaquinone biosynthesis C-methylase UbiE
MTKFAFLMIGDFMSLSQFTTRTPQVEYALGHSSRELDRLAFQGSVFAPFTLQLFAQAGIKPGMRVLDVGSGSGDVSFLVADLVGEDGHVFGVDRSAEAVQRARARAIRRNYPNVSFVLGDSSAMPFDQPFAAIVGRFVLMYQDDPVWSLREITKHLRANGLVVFQELDSSACRSCPAVPVFDEAARWLGEAFARQRCPARTRTRDAFVVPRFRFARAEHAHGRIGLWRSGESRVQPVCRSGAKFGADSAKTQHCFACACTD